MTELYASAASGGRAPRRSSCCTTTERDPTRSLEDFENTRRPREDGDLLATKLGDHVIIGPGRHTSFTDDELMR